MGQDAVRAIDLMEFNLGLQTARTAHLAAVANIKQFWRILSKRTLKSQVRIHSFSKRYASVNGLTVVMSGSAGCGGA